MLWRTNVWYGMGNANAHATKSTRQHETGLYGEERKRKKRQQKLLVFVAASRFLFTCALRHHIMFYGECSMEIRKI